MITKFQEFINTCLQYQYDHLEFTVKHTDDHLKRIGRPQVLALACALGMQSCITEAQQIYFENQHNLTRYNLNYLHMHFPTCLK